MNSKVGLLGVCKGNNHSSLKNRHSNNKEHKFSTTKNNSPSSAMLCQYQTDSILSHFLMLSKDKLKLTHKNQNSNDISLKLHNTNNKPQNMKFLNINTIHKGVYKGFNFFPYKNNVTTPCTTNHSRKHSNDNNKHKPKNTKESKSVSVSKTKKNILKGNNYTYKEIKNLLSKYSIFNKLNYTNNNSKSKSNGKKQHKQPTELSVSQRVSKYKNNKNKRKPKQKKMINLKQHKPSTTNANAQVNSNLKSNIGISIHIPPPLNSNCKTINTKNSLQGNTDYLTLPYTPHHNVCNLL